MKKLFLSCILVVLLGFLCGCEFPSNSKKVIFTTNFPCYDFVRAVVGKDSSFEVKMLLSPGEEVHDYEPTPKDIVDISKSSIFFYVGGESDEWVRKMMENGDFQQLKVLKMVDMVSTLEEEHVEGMEMEEESGIDEHVWTSLRNAKIILSKLVEEISLLDPEHQEMYQKNALDYISKIEELDASFQEIVQNAKRKELIFADRFPFLYFVRDYDLEYYAAFPGCSSQTEASAKTVQFLIDKVKNDSVPVIFHLELSSSKIAEAISKETGAKVLEFHSAHNVSLDEFQQGITYVDLMKRNESVLKEALNS